MLLEGKIQRNEDVYLNKSNESCVPWSLGTNAALFFIAGEKRVRSGSSAGVSIYRLDEDSLTHHWSMSFLFSSVLPFDSFANSQLEYYSMSGSPT